MDYEHQKISFNAIGEMFRNFVKITKIIVAERKGLLFLIGIVVICLSFSSYLQSGSLGFLLNQLVADAAAHTASPQLAWAVLLLVVVSVVPPFLFRAQDYLTKVFYFYLSEKFEYLIIKRKGEVDIAVHEDPTQHDLFSKIQEGGTFRVQNFAWRQVFILQNIAEIVIGAVVLTAVYWWLFPLLLIATAPELFVEAKYGRDVWGIHSGRAEFRRRYWDLKSHFEKVARIVELRLFQNIFHFLEKIQRLFVDFQNEEKKADKRKFVYQLFSLSFSQLLIGGAIVYLILDVIQGGIQIGTLTFLLASMATFRQSLSGLFSNLGRQYGDSLFVSDLFKFLSIPDRITTPPNPVYLPTDKTPSIVFENVSFMYPGTNTPVLRNISLTISPGDKIAIVGVNGAGKTTLIKLLCRFYDPTEGRILIDGHDLRTVDLESLYYHLGVLFQDYSNYHFLVRDLVALGRTSLPQTLERVQESAKSGEADEFIKEWPLQYEQTLGREFRGGMEPSIGQWQKLAISRAFYRDPSIYILDEPTSSIDAEAEAKIFERMEKLPKDKTVILISHRFSTVRQATQICVIEGGMISEHGTHAELLERNATYAHLFRLQAKGYQ